MSKEDPYKQIAVNMRPEQLDEIHDLLNKQGYSYNRSLLFRTLIDWLVDKSNRNDVPLDLSTALVAAAKKDSEDRAIRARKNVTVRYSK